jgi:hypothetical protein
MTPFKYHTTDVTLEVAVQLKVTVLFGLEVSTVVADAVMVMLVVCVPPPPPPPLPGAEAIHPASGSTHNNKIAKKIARYHARRVEFRKDTSIAEIDIDSLMGMYEGSAHSICHLSSGPVKYRNENDFALFHRCCRSPRYSVGRDASIRNR